MRLYAFELEFTINGERYTRTMVASCDDNARRDLCNCYPVDVGSIHLIAKKTRLTRRHTMTPEELIVKTANTFKQIAAGVSVNHIVSVTPVASTVAEMVVRAHWNPEDFTFRSEGSSVLFKAGNAGEVNLSGYNFAYQVKLCLDAITEAGYFV